MLSTRTSTFLKSYGKLRLFRRSRSSKEQVAKRSFILLVTGIGSGETRVLQVFLKKCARSREHSVTIRSRKIYVFKENDICINHILFTNMILTPIILRLWECSRKKHFTSCGSSLSCPLSRIWTRHKDPKIFRSKSNNGLSGKGVENKVWPLKT